MAYIEGQKLALAIEKGHNMRGPAVELLKRGEFNFEVWQNGGLHALVHEDLILKSITLNRGEDIAYRLKEGVAQFGIFGRDRLREAQLAKIKVEEVLPLGISLCRIVLEVPIASDYRKPEDLEGVRVATSYPNQTRKSLQHIRGITIIRYAGGEESAPDAGAAEAVVAAYVSGGTARENHLRLINTLEASTILESEAVLVSSSPFLQEHGSDRIVEQFISKIRQIAHPRKVANSVSDRAITTNSYLGLSTSVVPA